MTTNIKLKAQLVYLYWKTPRKKRRAADKRFCERLEQILERNYDLEIKINKENVNEYYQILTESEKGELQELWILALKN